jgi:hypothetical protein
MFRLSRNQIGRGVLALAEALRTNRTLTSVQSVAIGVL